jgi:hypothetical protein
MTAKAPTLQRMWFVVSPIGREGTELYRSFRDVLDFVIKPAVEHSGLGLEVIRADDIERAGSFIKDILEYIAGAYVVIADLSGQNPNVFYELGVRHALSARTILIAQQLDDIPFRPARVPDETIIYDPSARGAAVFRQRIERYLKEIEEDRERPDNPVLDRLGSVADRRTRELERLHSCELSLKLLSVVGRQNGGRARTMVRRRSLLRRVLSGCFGCAEFVNTGLGRPTSRLPIRKGERRSGFPCHADVGILSCIPTVQLTESSST